MKDKQKYDISFSKEFKKDGFTVCTVELKSDTAKEIGARSGMGTTTEIFVKDKSKILAWAISHALCVESVDSIVIQRG